MCQIWERRETHTGFGRERVKYRGHLEDLGVDGSKIFKWNVREWSGIILLRIQTNGRLL
jgi:hypothetical protein